MTKKRVFNFVELGRRFGFSTESFLNQFWDWDHKFGNEAVPDLIVFGGGQDIATEMYKADPIYTDIPSRMSSRDIFERAMFEYAVSKNVPMLGICRGAQLLCALNGGLLFQEVDGHRRDHTINFPNGKTIEVTSSHHQMMIPPRSAEIWGWASTSTHREWDENPEIKLPTIDPEIVYFPETRSLAVQYHPEYIPDSEMGEYTRNLVNKMLDSKE